jgi:hypothetical protein
MENIVTKFNITGECEISVDEAKKVWDKSWCVSQWKDEYTLCHHNRNMENFTRTDFKVRISEIQAKELMRDLKLVSEKSPMFNNAYTWKVVV